jgi:hypothetical protein
LRRINPLSWWGVLTLFLTGGPVRTKSKKKIQKEDRHKPIREAVMNRAKGHCEGCGHSRPLEWAHLFSRGNQIGEPLCSMEETTAALCRDCHTSIDQYKDRALRERLQWRAIEFLTRRHPVIKRVTGNAEEQGFAPLVVMKWIERAYYSNSSHVDYTGGV